MIVENGTGLENANSYVSVEYLDDYFTSRGYSCDKTEEEKEMLLVQGSDYIDNVFDWNGKKATQEQSMNFPRVNLYDRNGYEVAGVPKAIKDAVCEAIKVLLSTELYQSANENGAVISENIGGKLSFTYDVSQKIQGATLYESINARLKGLYKDTTKKKIYSAQVRRKL